MTASETNIKGHNEVQCFLQPGAENEIEDAYTWYENQLIGLGDQFLVELEKYYEQLKLNPLVYGWAGNGFRQVILNRFPYIVVFKVINTDVHIFAVFHTSRNPKGKLNNR